ncbi:tyrosine-type recombinase/integrase [Lutibacter holmesii]|uniref:Tyrosine-type recombinase/integrase n=1 Tax=Lutibacter holmesii TaxID=1137985 RepID=A0ABW3WJZ1_9FLAO
MDFNISIYLDKRTLIKHSKNLYRVKLRVYSNITKKAKLYSTKIDLSIEDFEKIFNSTIKVKKKLSETKSYLLKFEQEAIDVCKELDPFTFEKFERKFFRNKNAAINVAHHYLEKINALLNNDQIATANNYELSLKSFGMFILKKTKFNSLEEKEIEISKAIKNFTFYDVTADWLEKYEYWMVKKELKSFTTVSMYVRCLRTIFNDAISENDIKEDIYPFGRGKTKYQIPSSQKTKKALKSSQLTILFQATPETLKQEKAKDFWFLSYALYGINFKDICLLTYSDLNEDSIKYFREKTVTTKKSNLKEISIPLNDYAKQIIEKYSNPSKKKTDYVFTVVDKKDNAFEQKRKIKNFISFINLHINKIAKKNGVNFKISTYWARHSFASVSIQNGATMEFISEALNHSNMNVTKGYFSGFDDKTKKQFSKNLMNF